MDSESQINFKTLQRVDSNIVEIIDNASQVAIYKYDNELKKWEDTDIEGAFFLYRRCLSPRFGFIIVNRSNTTNFVESITGDMQFQLQEPYLLYKNHTGEIIGAWFYEGKDLVRITQKVLGIILREDLSRPRRTRCTSENGIPRSNRTSPSILDHPSLREKNNEGKKPDLLVDASNNNFRYLKQRTRQTVPDRRQTSPKESAVSLQPHFLSTGSSAEAITKAQNLKFKEDGRQLCSMNEKFPPRPFEFDDRIVVDDYHQSCLKESFRSHLKNDSEVILKIHEAYVCSLRSLLSKKGVLMSVSKFPEAFYKAQ